MRPAVVDRRGRTAPAPKLVRALLSAGEAFLALLRSEWTVRRCTRGEGISLRRFSPVEGAGPAVPDQDGGDAPGAGRRRVIVALDRVCRVAPWRPGCLARALALEGMLRRRGYARAEVRVGVRRKAGEFSAHAWVVCGGEVVGDDPEHVAEYEPLPALDVFPA